MDRIKESVSEAPEGVTGQQVTVHFPILELRERPVLLALDNLKVLLEEGKVLGRLCAT